MDAAFLADQIAQLKVIIDAYNSVILQLITAGATEEYLLDTGQTRTRVKKSDLGRLRADRQALLNELAVLCNRQNGGGSLYGSTEN